MKAFVRFLLLIGLISSTASIWAQAPNIYLANTPSGGGDGSSCANARAWTWFNSGSNWGTGASQIGPGTTVHLCGTITQATGGSNGLIPQGSGASGNLITIKFEPGAILQAPYWGTGKGDEWTDANGAGIFFNNVSYFVVDGGGTASNADCNPTNAGNCGLTSTNGIIQDTANGSALANQVDDVGIAIYGNSSNIEIKNLDITDIMVHQNGSDSCNSQSQCAQWNGRYATDIDVDTTGTNIQIHNNFLSVAGKGVSTHSKGTVSVYNNYMNSHVWMMFVGGGLTFVYNNEWTDWANWEHPINNYHQDGVHAFGNSGYNYFFYNNYVHGDMCPDHNCSVSAMFYNENDNPMYVFNNLVIIPNNAQSQPSAWKNNGGQNYLYNNTFVNTQPTQGVSVFYDGGTGSNPPLTSENNVGTAQTSTLPVYSNGGSSPSCAVSDYNVWYNFGSNGCSEGSHSTTSNPNLNTDGLLQSGSPAIGRGANLTSLCVGNLASLCLDKAGNPRPATGAWDSGAYQFNVGLAPPKNVLATAH